MIQNKNTSNFISSQKIQISVTQLDENLSPIDNTCLEINSKLIDNLNLELDTWGFTGKVRLTLPFSTEVAEEFQIFFENRPLKLDFTLTLNYKLDQNLNKTEKSTNTETKFSAIVGINSDIQKKFSFSHYNEDKPSKADCITVNIAFQDFLQGLWSNHWGISVYTDKSILDLFAAENKPYNNLLQYSIDQSAESILSSKRPMLVMNCNMNNDYSLYQLLINVLNQYGLSLFYIYNNSHKSNYVIADSKSYLSSIATTQVMQDDLNMVSQVTSNNSTALKHYKQYNTAYTSASIMEIEATPVAELNETISNYNKGAQAFCSADNTQSEFNTLLKKQANPLFDLAKPRVIFKKLPSPFYKAQIFPVSRIKLDSNLNIINYHKQDLPELIYVKGVINFQKTKDWSNQRSQERMLDERINYDTNKTYSDIHLFENDTPRLYFNCTLNMSFLHYSDCAVLLPKEIKPYPALKVIGQIYTTENAKSNPNSEHLIFDGYSGETTSVNTDKNNNIFSTNKGNNDLSSCYYLELPSTLISSESSATILLVPVSISQFNINPNYYSLLKSGTQIEAELLFEDIKIQKVLGYTVPNDQFTKGSESQNNYIHFESNDDIKAYISSEYSPNSAEHTLDMESSFNEQTRKISLTNNYMKILYKIS